jgi:hypothetical protein
MPPRDASRSMKRAGNTPRDQTSLSCMRPPYYRSSSYHRVDPAKAGIRFDNVENRIPAFAGMTNVKTLTTYRSRAYIAPSGDLAGPLAATQNNLLKATTGWPFAPAFFVFRSVKCPRRRIR